MFGLFRDEKVNNLRLFTLKKGSQGFLIEPKQAITNISTKIVIEYSGKISEFSKNKFGIDAVYVLISFAIIGWDNKINFHHQGELLQFSAFLGIVNILNENFLVFVEEVEEICTLHGVEKKVFEVKKIQLIQMIAGEKQEISKDIKSFIERIEKILSFGHYFVFDYPLTSNQSKQLNSQSSYPYEQQFCWNHSLLKPLVNQGLSKPWHLQLVQGFIKSFSSQLNSQLHVKYYLISRRSHKRSGTRCNHRGADTEGNTANFVEHETIYVINKGQKVVSHVQIRGSLPILWEQNGIKGKIGLAGGEQISLSAFKKHLKNITENYGKVFSISLMAEGRSGEKLLTSTFKSHYEKSSEFHQTVAYDTFDIKQQCKGGKYENINPYISELSPIQLNQGYFLIGSNKSQKGIIRTNCKSSLDRTNIFQSKLELNLFQIMLQEEYNIDFKKTFGCDALVMMENLKSSIQFVRDFKILWSQNGDNISQHYAGTNALTSHATKTGQAGIFGKLKGKFSSLKRLYEGTFQDSHKQETTDIILGKHTDSSKALRYEEELKKEAHRRQSQFLGVKQVSVFLMSWSLCRFLPPNTNFSLKLLFKFQELKPADILVFSFQKKAVYKNENVEESQLSEKQFYLQWITNNIKAMKIGEYAEVDIQIAEEVITIILASSNIVKYISRVEHEELTSSSIGKGVVVVKMNVKDTKLCFINAHLQSGIMNSSERIQQIYEIHQKCFQQEGISKYKKEKIEKSDKIFLTGNLNFRVTLSVEEASKLIAEIQENLKSKNVEKAKALVSQYLSSDQLKEAKKSGILQNYSEGRIDFMPTFKMFVGRSSYDLQNQQAPSWCGRILMWNNEKSYILKGVQAQPQEINPSFLQLNSSLEENDPRKKQYSEGFPLFYMKRDLEVSNHRPVCAYYIVTVKEENHEVKDKLIQDLALKRMNSNKRPEQQNENCQAQKQEQEILNDSNLLPSQLANNFPQSNQQYEEEDDSDDSFEEDNNEEEVKEREENDLQIREKKTSQSDHNLSKDLVLRKYPSEFVFPKAHQTLKYNSDYQKKNVMIANKIYSSDFTGMTTNQEDQPKNQKALEDQRKDDDDDDDDDNDEESDRSNNVLEQQKIKKCQSMQQEQLTQNNLNKSLNIIQEPLSNISLTNDINKSQSNSQDALNISDTRQKPLIQGEILNNPQRNSGDQKIINQETEVHVVQFESVNIIKNYSILPQ